jgi:hypothetical protein
MSKFGVPVNGYAGPARRPIREPAAVTLLATKVLLAPLCVVAVSLAGRRWGVAVAGVLGGLPVVAGPILLVETLLHGNDFGADAAAGTLLGWPPLPPSPSRPRWRSPCRRRPSSCARAWWPQPRDGPARADHPTN